MRAKMVLEGVGVGDNGAKMRITQIYKSKN